MKFQIVDAFTDQIFGGNPAGVVLLPEGADFPADETMRQTAAELRYSETAFIKPLGGIFGIYELLPAFLVGLLVIVVVSLLTKAPDESVCAEFDAARAEHTL